MLRTSPIKLACFPKPTHCPHSHSTTGIAEKPDHTVLFVLFAQAISSTSFAEDSFDEKGRTLLTRACSNLGDKIWRNVLTALVSKRGADVNLPDGQGDLPICLAAHACSAHKNNPELNSALKLLCSAKADVGRRAEKGQFQNQSAISIALLLGT